MPSYSISAHKFKIIQKYMGSRLYPAEKRKRMKSYLTLLITLLFFSCNAQKTVKDPAYSMMLDGLLSHSVKEISIDETKKLVQTNVVYVDAREQKEYETSHIKNALWVGYESLNLNSLKSTPKDKTIIVYCSIGYRSEKVSEKLLKQGYKDVRNLYGGIFEWVNEGNPVYNSSSETKKVHAYDKAWGIWLKKGEKVY